MTTLLAALKMWLRRLPDEHPLLADAIDIVVWYGTFEWLRRE